jgi:hypothetical protein
MKNAKKENTKPYKQKIHQIFGHHEYNLVMGYFRDNVFFAFFESILSRTIKFA